MGFKSIMDCHEDNLENFKRLRGQIKDKNVIPFVGAGLTIPPYYTWGNLLKNLLTPKHSKYNELLELLKKDYEEAAQFVLEQLGYTNFNTKLENKLDQSKINDKGLSNSLQWLPYLFENIIVTTNYDKCIEHVYMEQSQTILNVYTHKDVESLKGKLSSLKRRSKNHTLIKMHGDIENVSQIVLTKESYEELYGENSEFVGLLKDIFANKMFLFLGCSLLGDDRYFSVLNALGTKAGMENYAFLPKDCKGKNFDKKIRMLSENTIIPIWYPDGKYESVETLLNVLNKSDEQFEKIIRTYESKHETKVGELFYFAEDPRQTDWRVLDIKDNKVLVISENILCFRKYNEAEQNVSWKNCSLRKWLNKEFIDEYFSAEMKNDLVDSSVLSTDYSNETYTTIDKIFLLEEEEIKNYYLNNESRKAMFENTCESYWLRSLCIDGKPGKVNKAGIIAKSGNKVSLELGVRPAMWIKID